MGIFLFMLKIILLLILLLNTLFSNTISWHANYEHALQKAHQEKKNILLFIASSQTKDSNEILKTYFLNQAYIEYLNTTFINVLVTVEHQTSYPIELFYTTTFPTIFFVSYKDESVLTHPIYTFESTKTFIEMVYSIQNK
jgi:hypothetical protein